MGCGVEMRLVEETDFAATEARCGPLLTAGAAESFFLAPWWWRTMLAAGLQEGESARFLVAEEEGVARMLLPLLIGRDGATDSLTGPYTCFFRPLFAPDLDAAGIERAGRATALALRAAAVVRLDAIDGAAPWLPPFEAGLRAGGLRPLRFAHFGNWHELVTAGWDAYMAVRPGALRETVRRKLKRDQGVTLDIITAEGLEAGIAAYEEVYARSWKTPEPLPRFNGQMMREAAAAGALRLGILRSEGQVIAAQIWIVANGAAMVVKLAHDEAFKPLSPGTVLTARMIRHLLDEGVQRLDFGRGDDPYKQSWTTQRGQLIGIVLANPWRPRGAATILRHVAGRWRRRLMG